uniref:Uncharacterized protein n=1 Tax=Panagrolaimus superbus TaxID=310955 RepID=A0A914Z7A1_9BILA
MKPVLKCYDIDIDSFSSPQSLPPSLPCHRNYNDLPVIRAPSISKPSIFSYSDSFPSNSISSSKPIGYIPPLKNIPKSSSTPLAPWKSSLSSSTKAPAPIIQDIVPLDNLSGTLERKSKEPLSKPWYSTSVDSTTQPSITTSTLPRNFQKQPSGFKTSAITRSVSFKDPRPLLPTTGPPEEEEDDNTIIEIPPPKPIRSYQEFKTMPKPEKPEFFQKIHKQSPEEFLRNKTLFAVPKIDLNNNQDISSNINKNSAREMSTIAAAAAAPPTFESRFPSIFTNSTNSYDSNIASLPRNSTSSNYLAASSTPNRYTQKTEDYETINNEYEDCYQKTKVECYDPSPYRGEKTRYFTDERDYGIISSSKQPNEIPSFNSTHNSIAYDRQEPNPYSSSQSLISQKARMLGNELYSLSSSSTTPKINYAAQSSTLPGQSIKTNLPKLPAFPAAVAPKNSDRQLSPILNLHNLKNTDLSTSDNMMGSSDEYTPRINYIRPVEMHWNPTSLTPAAGTTSSTSKFQRGAVDEREKKNQKFLRRKKSCRENYESPGTSLFSTVADEEYINNADEDFVEQEDFENNNFQGEYISDDYEWMFDGKWVYS